MKNRILITSFDTWLPHQKSNASDDLLLALEAEAALPPSCRVLHRLPVSVDQAFAQIAGALARQPAEILVCCGMAEQRSRLSIELRAVDQLQEYWTPFALDGWYSLRNCWQQAELSEDAGRFVCNDVYARILKHQADLGHVRCLFIHVPPLSPERQVELMADFALTVAWLGQWEAIAPGRASAAMAADEGGWSRVGEKA
jgi:pyroglutamyl-peptidase